jgi:ABC-type multidrug transport system ATPase subunit
LTEPAALSLEHIAKRFGPVEALADASIAVRAGALHALLGENGAGKTTLMRVAFGLVHPDAGTVRVRGEPVSIPNPAAALARGIGMVHQHFTFVPAMTVAENVALAGGEWRGTARERVRAIAEETGLVLDPAARAGELPVGAQQRLEIVKALARGARILILDEPTAVLAPAEVAALAAVLRRFAAAGGAVVVITHKLREALAFADDVTVLRRGRTVLTGAAALVVPAPVPTGIGMLPSVVRSLRMSALASTVMSMGFWPSTWSCVTVVPPMAVRSALPTWLAFTPRSAIRCRFSTARISGCAASALLKTSTVPGVSRRTCSTRSATWLIAC